MGSLVRLLLDYGPLRLGYTTVDLDNINDRAVSGEGIQGSFA